jgi:phosphate starvation-inducible PhoH-like protein
MLSPEILLGLNRFNVLLKELMRKNTRTKKIVDGKKPLVHEKFLAPTDGSVQQNIPRLEPSNQNQKTLLGYLREGRAVVIAQGSAGVGKSFVAAFHASNLMKQKKVDKIVLVRANVAAGKSIGLLPGTADEKLAPFFAQTLSHLETFMGKGHVKYCQDKQTIMMQPIEYLRGHSIEQAFILVEECQNLTASEFELIITRLGEGSQIVFTGDFKQSDLKGEHGLTSTINMIQKAMVDEPDYLTDEDLDEFHNNIGVVTFTPDDVVRSGICKAFVKLYYHQ